MPLIQWTSVGLPSQSHSTLLLTTASQHIPLGNCSRHNLGRTINPVVPPSPGKEVDQWPRFGQSRNSVSTSLWDPLRQGSWLPRSHTALCPVDVGLDGCIDRKREWNSYASKTLKLHIYWTPSLRFALATQLEQEPKYLLPTNIFLRYPVRGDNRGN